MLDIGASGMLDDFSLSFSIFCFPSNFSKLFSIFIFILYCSTLETRQDRSSHTQHSSILNVMQSAYDSQ